MSTASRLATLCLLILLAACTSSLPHPRTASEQRLFGPVSMKIDLFSKVKDWSGDNKPDGVECLVEFDDRFGDRTKADGTILFELFDYRMGFADPRGHRLANPWTAALLTFDQQKAHWDSAAGAYGFRLQYDQAQWDRDYVLTATFDSADGNRFFSRVVLRKQEPENSVEPTTQPESGLGHRAPAP